mgnify:FL=1
MSFTAIITANVQDFEKGVQQAQKSIDGLEKGVSSRLQNIGTKFTEIGQRMSLITAAFVAAGGASFKMAADFQDAMGATEQVFKTASKAMQDWAQNLSPQYGIAKGEALQYSNMMGSMLVNIGQLTEEQAAKQAQTLIMLAGDLTAMFGGTTADAVRALTGALKGNNSMLDNYGMAVNDATVKARAFEMGLVSQGSEMSLAAKQAATLSLIMEQSGAAQGQAAREADGASGSMRQMQTEIKNLSTQFGEVLLPVITPIISAISGFVSSLRNVSPEILQTGVVIAGLVAAAGPVLMIIGKIIAILPTLKAGFLAVSAAIGGITAPVALVVAAIAGAVILIISNWDKIKEYFTSGGGAEAFNSIKQLAIDVKDKIVSVFNSVKEAVQIIWGKIGGTITYIFRNAFDNVVAVLDFFMDTIKNVADFFRAIVNGDMKGALNALWSQFSNVFSTIGRFVTNTVSSMAGTLAGFLKVVGLEKWGASVQGFADRMANAFSKPKTEIQATTTAVAVHETAVKKVTKTYKDLEDQATKTGKKIAEASVVRVGKVNPLAQPAITGLTITPTIDTSKIDVGMAEVKTKLADAVVDLTDMSSSGITSFAQIIGKSFGSGNWDNIGSELISAIGGLAQQFGSMMIGMGVAALALKKLILSPMTAIAAGVALVALGAAASAAASNMVNKTTGGGGASYGGGATGSYQSVTTPGASEYRGQYQDEYTVNFKIGNDELIGTLDRANQKRNRI